jgi:hypothetical protein
MLLIVLCHERGNDLPKIVTNADEPPAIDVLVEPLPWNEIESYVRVSKRFLLVEVPDSGGQYRGFYFSGNVLGNTADLGTDQAAAIKAFRDHLRQPA